MGQSITPHQMKRLQTLYGQLIAHVQEGSGREARLAWASEQAQRPVSSFSALSADEAKRMIDGLQGQLGLKAAPRRRHDRDAARRAGKDGRRDGVEFSAQPQIASADDIATVERYYLRLGWTRAQFDAWLASSRSPLGRRARPVIASSADANRVRWALKGMLQNRGLWEARV